MSSLLRYHIQPLEISFVVCSNLFVKKHGTQSGCIMLNIKTKYLKMINLITLIEI